MSCDKYNIYYIYMYIDIRLQWRPAVPVLAAVTINPLGYIIYYKPNLYSLHPARVPYVPLQCTMSQ